MIGKRNTELVFDRWFLGDSERAELPIGQTADTLPIGVAIDFTASNQVWEDYRVSLGASREGDDASLVWYPY